MRVMSIKPGMQVCACRSMAFAPGGDCIPLEYLAHAFAFHDDRGRSEHLAGGRIDQVAALQDAERRCGRCGG